MPGWALCIQGSRKSIVPFIDFHLSPHLQPHIPLPPSIASSKSKSQAPSGFCGQVSPHLGCRRRHAHSRLWLPLSCFLRPHSSIKALLQKCVEVSLVHGYPSPNLFFRKVYMFNILLRHFWRKKRQCAFSWPSWTRSPICRVMEGGGHGRVLLQFYMDGPLQTVQSF